MKTETYFKKLEKEFNEYLSYYVDGSLIPFRFMGEKLLKYCKVKNGEIGFYAFEGEYSDIIGYSIKPNKIYLNPNYYESLKKWNIFLSTVIHEIGHLKGLEHTEKGIMAETIII